MRAIVTSELVMLRLISVLSFCLFATDPANSQDGDVFLCAVNDFHALTDLPSSDDHVSFMAINRARTFEVYEFADSFTVIGKTSGREPHFTNYEILKRDILDISAVKRDSPFLETFLIETEDPEGPPIKARVTLQAASFLNSWYLDCTLQK